MDFPAHGESAIQADIWYINYILVEHGDRITNMTAGATDVPEAWTCFHFEKRVVHVYVLIYTPRDQTSPC